MTGVSCCPDPRFFGPLAAKSCGGQERKSDRVNAKQAVQTALRLAVHWPRSSIDLCQLY